MRIAFVLLYLSFGTSGTEEVPMKFSTIAECQATFDAIRIHGSATDASWANRQAGYPTGICVPVVLEK